jgi:NAD(P)H-flavin reductase
MIKPAITSTPFLPAKAKLRSIVPMTEDNYLFEFSEPSGSLKTCQPGQFVELWIPSVGESPISVCSGRVGDTIQLMVRRCGRVTDALFKMVEGDWVGLRGPYGQGFPVEHFKGKNVCIIAGGLGVAPIRSLWQYIFDRREDYGHIILIYGMRHSIDLLFRHELQYLYARRDLDLFIGAEDIVGPEPPALSVQIGRVTDMIKQARVDASYQVAVCGPPIMYKYVVESLHKKNVPDENMWLSLERHMKCAIGKCGHCFIGGRSTCQSGPVFQLTDLALLPEVIECDHGVN